MARPEVEFHGQGSGPGTAIGTPGNPYNHGAFGNAPGEKNPDVVTPPPPVGGHTPTGTYVGPPTGGTGTPIPGDLGLNMPGRGETHGETLLPWLANTMWGEKQAREMLPGITDPGAGQDYWANVGQGLTGNTGAGNPMMQAYQNFMQSRPDIASDPGLGGYYDNAKRRTQESIGQQAAAAGGYGSSVMQDVGAEAVGNLEAERANREADYNLRRMAEQRGWEGLGLQGAGMAADSQLGWAQGLGKLAFGAEEADLARNMAGISAARGLGHDERSRILSGMDVASNMQTLRENRIGGLFGNVQGFGNQVSNTLGNAFSNITEQDLALIEAQHGPEVAAAIRAAKESDENQASNTAGAKDTLTFAQGQGW